MARAKPDPHAAWRKRLVSATTKHTATKARLGELDRERARLYMEGRELDPPLTFAEIGRIAGVSQAAVIQAADRERKRQERGE